MHRRLSQSGQGTLEYLGIFVAAVTVVLALIAFVPGVGAKANDGLERAVCTLTSVIAPGPQCGTSGPQTGAIATVLEPGGATRPANRQPVPSSPRRITPAAPKAPLTSRDSGVAETTPTRPLATTAPGRAANLYAGRLGVSHSYPYDDRARCSDLNGQDRICIAEEDGQLGLCDRTSSRALCKQWYGQLPNCEVAPTSWGVASLGTLCGLEMRDGRLRLFRCGPGGVGPCFDVDRDNAATIDPVAGGLTSCEPVPDRPDSGPEAESICSTGRGIFYACVGTAISVEGRVGPERCDSRTLPARGTICPEDSRFPTSDAVLQTRSCVTAAGKALTCVYSDRGKETKGLAMHCVSAQPPTDWVGAQSDARGEDAFYSTTPGGAPARVPEGQGFSATRAALYYQARLLAVALAYVAAGTPGAFALTVPIILREPLQDAIDAIGDTLPLEVVNGVNTWGRPALALAAQAAIVRAFGGPEQVIADARQFIALYGPVLPEWGR